MPILFFNRSWPRELPKKDDERRSAMIRLSRNPRDLTFPPVEQASSEGLLAIGGDLRPERLLEAYRHGIFPWYNEEQPILWWSPDPRTVLFPEELHISRSLKRSLRPGLFTVTFDTCFLDVVRHCAAPRPQYPEGGTWITPAMVEAYSTLHEQGYAHSVETWQEGSLVGGVYGVAIGGAFFAESMFTKVDDASKVALVSLVRQLQTWGFRIVDCQQSSPHVMRLGAEEILRAEFVAHVAAAVKLPDRRGHWTFNCL
jgi:leucyl/phenylalanyl-tRNA---protein transferase